MLMTLAAAGLLFAQAQPYSRLFTLAPPPDPAAPYESQPFQDGQAEWDEAIVSWNVKHPDGAALKIECRGVYPDHLTGWYCLGNWTSDGKDGSRASVKGQKDVEGEVFTDTLRMVKPCPAFQLRLSLNRTPGSRATLGLVTLCLSNSAVAPGDQLPRRAAWGRTLEPPLRSQMSYPNGNVLCSPTAISTLLGFWSAVLARPDLDHDVPEVAAGVYDPNWPGTGNWPFNTAYAGSASGLHAFVTRLDGIWDLESCTAAGQPVATSVAYDFLQGKSLSSGKDGHIVVLVGFTKEGDPVFNDPGCTKEVRQVYKRADFVRAWNTSRRTVYIVQPDNFRIPKGLESHWATEPK